MMKTEVNIIDDIENNLRDLPGNEREAADWTIFRVPAHTRQKNKELYEPRMISIGPYYNGNEGFEAMEKQKLRYLRDCMSRNTKITVGHLISELRGLQSEARKCYFEPVKFSDNQFLKMMLLDGCFIVEFLLKWNHGYPEHEDRMVDISWALPTIRSDLLLLENQLPLFIIQKLFSLLIGSDYVPEENTSEGTPHFAKILVKYLSEGKKAEAEVLAPDDFQHILHLYHHLYVHQLGPPDLPLGTNTQQWLNPIKLCFRRTESTDGRTPAPRTIPSATELDEAGIIFKCNESDNFLDVKFRNGTLEIPVISIEETRRSRMLKIC